MSLQCHIVTCKYQINAWQMVPMGVLRRPN
jgi:hypothetical protein